MMEDYKTKDMASPEPKDDVTFTPASGVMYDFFFPGSGKWKPVTVRAESREVAQQLWEAHREPVQSASAEVKTEEKEEPVEETKPNE